jgi:hypothetical protein
MSRTTKLIAAAVILPILPLLILKLHTAELTDGSVAVAWDPSPPEQRVTSYNVYAADATSTNIVPVRTTNAALSQVLRTNVTFTLWVTAVNAAGESDPSSRLTVTYWASRPGAPLAFRLIRLP